jgi:rubrerythrin
MPEFGNPFSVLKHDRLLTHEELVRAIRFMIAAEYEAMQLYEQLAESTNEALAQNVLRDIANEEKVHAGEFLRLLKELQPDEEGFYLQGALEVEEEFLNKNGEIGNASSKSSSSRGLGIGSLRNQLVEIGDNK